MPSRNRLALIDQLMDHRDWSAAKVALDRALAADASDCAALLRRSTVNLRLDRYRDALADVQAAHAARPASAPILLLLARQLMAMQQVDAMSEVLESACLRAEAPAFALVEAASLLQNIGAAPRALSLLDLAVSRDPRSAPARYTRGTTRLFLGDWQGAEQDLESSLRIDAGLHQASFALASLRKQTADANHTERLLSQLATTRPGSHGEVLLRFALFSELNDLQRYDEAWQHLELGCASKRRQIAYDHDQSLSLLDQIAATCDSAFFQCATATDDALGIVPIFIVGMQRSGTTLLERILAGHSAISDGGESYAFSAALKWETNHNFVDALDAIALSRAGQIDYHRLGCRYLESVRGKARGKRFVTEKLPANFQNVGLIAKALPQALFLHMVRDPVETCFSNLRALFTRASGFSYEQLELAEYFLAYRRLMAHWRRMLPGRILEVDYSALVQNPERMAGEIFRYCGLKLETAALDVTRHSGAVNTLSAVQVRGGIVRDRHGAWKPYERHLGPLIARLARSTHTAP